MASRLAEAHIEGERRIRAAVVDYVTRVWRDQPGYDRRDVPAFLDQVVPAVLAAQRQSVAITEAYIARYLGRQPLGVVPDELIGAGIRGVAPAEVYERPFVTVWSALGAGTAYEQAVSAGLQRAVGTAAMDVQMSMRATANAVQQADEGIFGYERVADAGACEFCSMIDGAYVKFADAMPLHNNCVLGDSVVWVPAPLGAKPANFGRAHAATRRWYEGEVVVLYTAAGHELTVTPNHPVLTAHGWVAAGLLREGDSVVSGSSFDGVGGRIPNEKHVPARIEDCFRAGAMAAVTLVPFAPEQFHGDAGQGEVDVVALHGGLDAGSLAALLQPREQSSLTPRARPTAPLACRCGLRQRRFVSRPSTHRRIGSRRPRLALAGGLSGGAGDVLLARGAERHAGSDQVRPNRMTSDAEALRQGEHRFAGGVHLDSIRETRRVYASRHVFNLVTSDGWYMANSIVTHNCGCGLEPLSSPHPRAAKLPSGVAVHHHGELGPVLADPANAFTGPSGLN